LRNKLRKLKGLVYLTYDSETKPNISKNDFF